MEILEENMVYIHHDIEPGKDCGGQYKVDTRGCGKPNSSGTAKTKTVKTGTI